MPERPYIPARPTVYNGIKMRSRLEAGFARWLDTWPFVKWQYEPQAFAGKGGQYLPDFVADGFRTAWSDGLHRVYFEVKPPVFGCQTRWDEDPHVDPAEWEAGSAAEDDLWRRMAIIWASEPEVLLCLVKQKTEGQWADFWVAENSDEFGGEGQRVDLIPGSTFGYVPAFCTVADPAVPPWPPRYWERF